MSVRVQTYVWQVELPPSHKLTAIALADHCHDDGSEARPSRALLVKKTGLSEATLRRVLKDLIEWGILVLDRPASQHRANCYRFVLPEGFGTIPDQSPRRGWKNPGVSNKRQTRHYDAPQTRHYDALTIKEPSLEPSEEIPLTDPALISVRADALRAKLLNL